MDFLRAVQMVTRSADLMAHLLVDSMASMPAVHLASSLVDKMVRLWVMYLVAYSVTKLVVRRVELMDDTKVVMREIQSVAMTDSYWDTL
jgi:hypothetical protein